MRRLYLRDVIGNDKITDSYFTIDLVYFYDIPYENIAFCRGNNESSYKQYVKSKTLNYYSSYDDCYNNTDNIYCSRIDFSNYKLSFTAEDLINKSITSYCGGCDSPYILTFIEGSDINYKTEDAECFGIINSNRPFGNILISEEELPSREEVEKLFESMSATCYCTYIGVDNFKDCADGKELVKKIIEILQLYEGKGVTAHNQFFFCLDSILYITDYRAEFTWWPIFYDFSIMLPKMEAEYIGPEIEVKDSFDINNVVAKLIYPDGIEEIIETDQLKFSSIIVRAPGTNKFFVKYESLTAEIYVTGIYTFVEVNALYTGEPLYIGQAVVKEDVSVSEVYKNDQFIVPINRWDFISKRQITYAHIKDGAAIFWIKVYTQFYGMRLCKVIVPIAVHEPIPILFEAHYHGIQRGIETAEKDGTPVAVGQTFEKSAIHAHILTSEKEWIDIEPSDIMISDNVVRKPGRNIYTATYRCKDKVFIDKFEVFGYINRNTKEKAFRLYKIKGKEEIDVTSEYAQKLMVMEGVYNFTNKLFDSVLEFDTTFRLIAPKNTGLNTLHATEWIIIKGKFNCRMVLTHVFEEE